MPFLNGDISAAKLSLEVSGKIKGNVKADSAELMGVQRGKVQARLLTIHTGAVLKGAVNCEELIVESGAAMSGKFRVKPIQDMSAASRRINSGGL
jgi:cytoskeletal protein CcmA (bactofilin family)